MKKQAAIVLVAVLAAAFFTSCDSKTEVTKSTVELTKKGKIIEYTIEDFSESYYDETELKEYIDAAVEAYTGGSDSAVKVSECSVTDGSAVVTIEYESTETFGDFLDVAAFSGTVLEAQTAGYAFDVAFWEVTEDDYTEAKADDDSVESIIGKMTVDAGTVLENDDAKVLILCTDTDVIVPGTITYISDSSLSVTAKNTVTFTGEEQELIYVIYE